MSTRFVQKTAGKRGKATVSLTVAFLRWEPAARAV